MKLYRVHGRYANGYSNEWLVVYDENTVRVTTAATCRDKETAQAICDALNHMGVANAK
jgi:hypothetical protein